MLTTDAPVTAAIAYKAARTTVLIVEDESLVAEDLSECLDGLGYRVVGIADTGLEAIQLALVLRPSLVMMDIRLKGEMNGIEAAITIRRQLETSVVFLTAFSDERLLNQAQAAMPCGYLLKPYNERELKAVLHMALHKHRFDLQVRENQQWLHAVLRSMADGVVVCDPLGKVTFLNPAAERMTGFDIAYALGKRATEVLNFFDPSTDSGCHPLEIALNEGRTVLITPGTLLVRKDGSHLPVCDSCAPVFDKHAVLSGAVCIFYDDTGRLNEEQRVLSEERTRQLEIQVAELEKLDRLKDDFVSTVSHELRTPLSNMKLVLGLLQKAQDSEDRSRYMAILQVETEREIKLVNALLDLQNLEGRDDLPREQICLQEWLPPIVAPFRVQAAQNGQILSLDFGEGIPLLKICPILLERALSELLNNACKYTSKEGSILLQSRFVRVQQGEEARLELRLINTCKPIPEAEMVQLFNKFYRVPNNDPWQYGGTGLGLALVKRLVEQMQGEISVEKLGEGRIVFTIELPIVPGAQD